VDILDRTLLNEETCKDLGKYYRNIVVSVVKLVKLEQAEKYTEDHKLMQVLNKMILKCPKTLEPYLKELDPLPSHTIFVAYDSTIRKAVSAASIFDDIEQFLTKSKGLEISGLSQITRYIREHKAAFINEVQTDQQGTRKKQAAKFMSKLIHLCSGQYSDAIKKEAGECLGELGLSIPAMSAIITTDDAAKELHKEYEFDNLGDRISSKDWSVDYVMMEAKKSILELLNSYLTHNDVSIIRSAVNTLQSILNTPSGRTAYAKLNSETQLYLQPFLSGTIKTTVEPKNVFEVNHLTDELFSTSNKSHEDWVRIVSFTLVNSTGVQDEVLKLCGRLCKEKVDFAEHLFPFLIYNIFQGSEQKSYNARLSTLCKQEVLVSPHSSSRTIRLLLCTLNLLFRHIREQLIKEGAKNKKVQSDYWLDIPYAVVAQAAVRAHAYFTAFMYTECTLEDKYRLQTLTSNDFAFEDETPTQHKLLLDIYKNIDEPDGIYGVNRTDGIRSQ
jgi:hypothetical protein